MQRLGTVGGRIAAVGVAAMLSLAGVSLAAAATAGNYSGTTRQRDPRAHHHRAPLTISFRITTANDVRDLHFYIDDYCPDGHILFVSSSGYPPLQITGSTFGGSFGVARGKPGEGSTVAGRISGTTVTGTLTDAGWSHRRRALCRGKTTFTAHLS